MDKDHALKEKLTDWNRRKVVGSFDPGPPPVMNLCSNNASELTVFHETVHLEVWHKKLPKMHVVDEEKYVFEAIFKEWKKSGKWTDDEMIDAYLYVNDEVKKWNKTGKKFPYLQIPEIEQLNMNKNIGIR